MQINTTQSINMSFLMMTPACMADMTTQELLDMLTAMRVHGIDLDRASEGFARVVADARAILRTRPEVLAALAG